MLRLEGVCWSLPGGEDIVKDIDLIVPDGQLTVVTGPNGGGKTSLAKLIAGLEQPTGGHIYLDDQDITAWDVTRRARAGVAYAFQQPVRFKGLTVGDLIRFAAGGAVDETRLCDLLATVGLCANDYRDRQVDGRLSGGEMKRVELAGVLARPNARVLVFDEPEAGIDLWSFGSLIQVFENLKKAKAEALLVISHQERILDIADRIVVVAQGVVRQAGDRDQVLPGLLEGETAALCPRGKEAAS